MATKSHHYAAAKDEKRKLRAEHHAELLRGLADDDAFLTKDELVVKRKPIKAGQYLLMKDQVLDLLGGVSYSTLWSWMKKFGFPFPIELGPADGRTTRCGWLASEVYAWLEARPRRKIGGLREIQK